MKTGQLFVDEIKSTTKMWQKWQWRKFKWMWWWFNILKIAVRLLINVLSSITLHQSLLSQCMHILCMQFSSHCIFMKEIG